MTEREIQRRLQAIAAELHAVSQRVAADCEAAQREIERAIALLRHPHVARNDTELMQQLRDSVALCDAQKAASC